MSSKSTNESNKAVAKAGQTGLLAGIKNPRGAAFAGFVIIYVLFPPVVFMMTKPGGYVQAAVQLFWQTLLPHASSVPKDRIIPALATIYATFAYGVTGVISVAASSMGREESRDDEHPRAHIQNLRGLPLRLKSAHDHLIEAFPMWALAAALAQVLAPKNQQLINILGLAAISKVAVHYPAYVLNVPPVRSMAHTLATIASTAALYALATGAR